MQLGENETVIIAILVLFFGKFLTGKVRFLREYNIPEPVSGGLAAALVTWASFSFFDVEIKFELATRDTLLVIFFALHLFSLKTGHIEEFFGKLTLGWACTTCFVLGVVGFYLWPLTEAPFIYFQF